LAATEVGEGGLERRPAGIGVHEHERPPGVHLDRGEAELVGIEPGLVRGARGAAQPAVEPIGPGVVRALDRAAPLRLADQEGAAVAADVQERAQVAVAVERHDHRQAAHVRREDAAGAAELGGVAGVLPRALEDLLALRRGYRGVGIPAVGQRLDAVILPESILCRTGSMRPTKRGRRSTATWTSRRA
jgi:hypothetical protein